MPPKMPQIYWLLVGPRDVASSRNHGYRVHEYLRNHGWTSKLVITPLHWLRDMPLSPAYVRRSQVFHTGDIVVFQKISGPTTVSVLRMLKDEGINTVFIDCDYPLKLSEAELATVTVCPSEYLAEAYRREGISSVIVIPDTYEATSPPNPRPQNDRKLRCVWFGYIDPIREIELQSLRKLLSKHFSDMELVVVAGQQNRLRVWVGNNQTAEIKWDTDKSWDFIKDCDMAVITGSDYFWMQAKSSNRIVQAMALGLPVIAYPIPSYEAVIHHGRNGMLSKTAEDWIDALAAMRNPSIREQIAWTGYRYARRYFSLERIGEQWTAMFTRIGTVRPTPENFLDKILSDLRFRRLRAWASRGMAGSIAASIEPTLRLQRSYRIQRFKEWIQ
jgi:glycosyltransferase involved in cell wall biosynthesis